MSPDNIVIGKEDMGLLQRLLKASVHDHSNSHSKFLRQILVTVDITAPEYWWSEFDTYKVGTVANSTSKMHKGLARPLIREDFEVEWEELSEIEESIFDCHIDILNTFRKNYKSAETSEEKEYWWRRWLTMIPMSYLQTRTVTLNYQVVRQMVKDRRHHKLPEWRKEFISWAETLPYAKELIMYEGDN